MCNDSAFTTPYKSTLSCNCMKEICLLNILDYILVLNTANSTLSLPRPRIAKAGSHVTLLSF
jgi:hypothetical protein